MGLCRRVVGLPVLTHPMRLSELLRRPHALPVVPDVAARLIATFYQDEVDLQRIAGEVERDPALAVRLLRQANSSFFRLVRPVHSVRDAVAGLIGRQGVGWRGGGGRSHFGRTLRDHFTPCQQHHRAEHDDPAPIDPAFEHHLSLPSGASNKP